MYCRVGVVLCLFGAFFLGAPDVFADTLIDEDAEISTDTVWTKSGSPYVLSGSISVDNGATLTIEPGVQILMNSPYAWFLVYGSLVANATRENPIHFTSAISDTWESIQADGGTIVLSNVVVDHASIPVSVSYGSSAILRDVTLRGGYFGLEIYSGSTVDASGLAIEDAEDVGVEVSDASKLTLASSTISHSGAVIGTEYESVADISNLQADTLSGGFFPYYDSTIRVRGSQIHNVGGWSVAIITDGSLLAVENSEFIDGTGDGLSVFDGGRLDLHDSRVSGFSGSAIQDLGSRYELTNQIQIDNTEITRSGIGISYDSRQGSLSVASSSIHDNDTGVEIVGNGTVDLSNNYWGDPSGPYVDPEYTSGGGDDIVFDRSNGGTLVFAPWLSSWGVPPVGNSNVLFLPGIESSRLYRPNYNGGADKLWEPNIDADVRDLYLNTDGSSVRYDIYTREGDVLDEMPNGTNVYKSFIGKINDLKAKGTITDWEPIAYDWRLSLDDILTYGHNIGGRIYYSGDLRATSTPYIIQELKRLASTSKSGKVTIIAHSNGGLLAKRLTEMLGPVESARLIDKMIFVAVPQAGTPVAIPTGLHGYEQDHVMQFVTSFGTARTLAINAPMLYQLLPSAQYFTQVDDPVVSLDASLPEWIARYGAVIHSQDLLQKFLTDSYGRNDPSTGNTNQPIQLNSTLLSNAQALHAGLDAWVPPAGVSLIQIAGWGVPKTVMGTKYKKDKVGVKPDLITTIDGDGTVVVPSALWTSTTTGVVNYWMNLRAFNSAHPFQSGLGWMIFEHSRILESTEVLNFLSDTISSNTKPLSDYIYLSTTTPASTDPRLRYSLHSPLTLNLYDDAGRHTGISTTTGQVEEQIPGTYYTELGDSKYIFSDASTTAHVVMNGYASGTFTFNVDQYVGNTRTASTTFQDIPTATSTIVSLGVQSDINTLSPMSIDKNGDGTIDMIIVPKINEIVSLDTTPPELRITFATSTKSLTCIATDDSGAATVTSTTTYPSLKKGQKTPSGNATTTVTALDAAGNSTRLVYTEQLPLPFQHDTIILREIAYNNATTTLSSSSISYKWRLNKDNSYNIFAANLHNVSAVLESHWRPKKNTTIIMTTPQNLNDLDSDDAVDIRPTKQMLPGMVVPYITTEKGALVISY